MHLGISVVTIIPTLILIGYVYYKDRLEREPFYSLAIAFAIGVLSFVISFFVEKLTLDGIDWLYRDKLTFTQIGTVSAKSEGVIVRHNILCAFLGVAFVEEGIKWLGFHLFAKKSKQLDCFYDGIVYPAFIAFGFAASACVRFSVAGDKSMLLLRAFSIIPAYVFFGILMGGFYTVWQAYKTARKLEDDLLEKNEISDIKIKKAELWAWSSFIIPLITHGLFQYVTFSQSAGAKSATNWLTSVLCVLSIIIINRYSANDGEKASISHRLIRSAHSGSEVTGESENSGEKKN